MCQFCCNVYAFKAYLLKCERFREEQKRQDNRHGLSPSGH